MNLTQMIMDLRAERDAITAAMAVLESISSSRGKRRGRPPAWLANLPGAKKEGPKRTMSAATRKKMALSQRKRWAEAKKSDAAEA
jgi:hypothetical protein